MICIPVSVKHHTCAQPDQATNSVRSRANASALLKRTAATGEDAGRWALRSSSVLYTRGLSEVPLFIAILKSFSHSKKKGIGYDRVQAKKPFFIFFYFLFKQKETFILVLHLPMAKLRKRKRTFFRRKKEKTIFTRNCSKKVC